MSSNDINMDDVKSYHEDMQRRQKSNGGKSKIIASIPVVLSVLALSGIAGMIWFAYAQGVKTGSEDFAPIVSTAQPIKTQPKNVAGKEFDHQDKQVYNNIDNQKTPLPATQQESATNIANNDNTKPLLPSPAPKTLLSSDSSSNNQKQSVSASAVTLDNDKTLATALNANAPAKPKNQQANNNLANNNLQAPTSLSLLSLATIAERTNSKPKHQQIKAAQPTAPKQANIKEKAQKPVNPLLVKTPTEPTTKPKKVSVATENTQITQATNTASLSNLAQNNSNAQNSSNWRVQIAAARSLQAARSEWVRRSKQFPEFFNNYELFIDRIKKNDGSEWFRVQINGFKDRNAAQEHCNGLKTVKISCFIVRPS